VARCSERHAIHRHQRLRNACFRAFLNNHYFGLVVFAGIVWQKFAR
jgi:4-hydroxybenzoate polyprenyltransferase